MVPASPEACPARAGGRRTAATGYVVNHGLEHRWPPAPEKTPNATRTRITTPARSSQPWPGIRSIMAGFYPQPVDVNRFRAGGSRVGRWRAEARGDRSGSRHGDRRIRGHWRAGDASGSRSHVPLRTALGTGPERRRGDGVRRDGRPHRACFPAGRVRGVERAARIQARCRAAVGHDRPERADAVRRDRRARVRAAAGRRRLVPVAVGAGRARCAAVPVVRQLEAARGHTVLPRTAAVGDSGRARLRRDRRGLGRRRSPAGCSITADRRPPPVLDGGAEHRRFRDEPVRVVLLLVGRSGGRLDAPGPDGQPVHRHPRGGRSAPCWPSG